MNTQILTTKLYLPMPRPYVVTRPRLVERLNVGLQPGRKLTLISAPAGFGKTTLASEWITKERLESSIAWISLDEGDNDANRFLLYLIAALQQIDQEIGGNVLAVLQSSQPFPLTELVSQIINQIAAARKKVLLVLDDYHLITAEAIHQVVQLLIERQPDWMHTILLTREDPPFPLPRMRARGQVTEIRERDLRFSLPEAQAFLLEAMGLKLSAEDVGKLKERTEGWAAGMQLAALALEDYTDEAGRRAFIEAFAGSDRFIVDYLISEVLERQSQTAREFLLATSLMDRFCADLCDQVVYNAASPGRSQAILDELEQGNMFLVPLDNQRQWYRYHHLFGEMLAHSLRRSTPDRALELHRNACAWFETKGYIQEAVKHAAAYAAAAGDWNFASMLLDRHAMRMLFQGQVSLVLEWCHAFPKAYLAYAPEICIYYAWALVLTFRNDYLDAVEEKLQLAEQAIDSLDLPTHAQVGQNGALVPLRDWVAGQICAVRSQILLGHFNTYIDPQELIALSLKGLDLLPEIEKASRSICKINLAHAQLMQNNLAAAQKAFEDALPPMLEAHNYLGSVTSIFYQARLAYYQGQMERAEALCLQWKTKFPEMSGLSEGDIPAIRGLDIVLSLLLLERNQIDEAERRLVQTLELLGWASWMDLYGFIMLARLQYQRGDYARADETIRRMASLGPQHASCAEALTQLFAVKTSLVDPQRRSRAEIWAKTNAPDYHNPVIALGMGPYHCDTEYFCNSTWAQVQIALGQPQAALTYIEPALKTAEEHQLTFRVIELTVARALAQEAMGDHSTAIKSLIAALDMAEPCGYIRVFDEGPALDQMLCEVAGRAAGRAVHREYIKRILTSSLRSPAETPYPSNLKDDVRPALIAPAVQIDPAPQFEPVLLVEAVSERELEVLHLIAIGLSNNQIAERLYITQGTVKRHITNLYGKLSVQSRTQAVAKAREIGLLA